MRLDTDDRPTNPFEWAARAFERPHDARPRWRDIARPEQLPPPGDWLVWLILAGRGWGKTRTCAEAAARDARRYPGARIALIAATFADGRDTMVEGRAGLLAVLAPSELKGGSRDVAWNRSLGELTLANGSRFKVFSSEKPDSLRGPEHHIAYADEPAKWRDAWKGTVEDTTWSNLLFGLRAPAEPGWPRDFRLKVYAATTPRNVALLKVPDRVLRDHPEQAGLLQQPSTVVTRGRTAENLANLAAAFRQSIVEKFTGTRLGRQELEGEMVEDVQGALTTLVQLDRASRLIGEVPTLEQVVVAIDPATTTEDTSDETGVVTVGADASLDLWVLDDRSGHLLPHEWARAAWESVIQHSAAAVVVEDNQGGDMVQHVLGSTWDVIAAERSRKGLSTPRPPIVRVTPSGPTQGKWMRALAFQPMFDQLRVHMVRDTRKDHDVDLSVLMDQLATWTGDSAEPSPDHVDALVHGGTWLLFPRLRRAKKTSPGARLRRRGAR